MGVFEMETGKGCVCVYLKWKQVEGVCVCMISAFPFDNHCSSVVPRVFCLFVFVVFLN